MFVFELQASDVYAVLGRVLDRARVAGMRLTAVSAAADDGGYTIRAAVDTADRDMVDRLARQFGAIVGVERALAHEPHVLPAAEVLLEAP